jgi:hypothetical protein
LNDSSDYRKVIMGLPAPLGIHVGYDPTMLPWETIYDEFYSHKTANSLSDIKSRCQRFALVLVGGRRVGETNLKLCAIAPPAEVFRATTGDNTHEVSGAHWYCREGKAMGFAPSSSVTLSSADTSEKSDTRRLSWHLTGSGGWRVGEQTGLNDSSDYRKVIMGLPAPLQGQT